MTIVTSKIINYPAELGGTVGITFVLTVGEVSDFAVYSGQGSAEWVAEHGDKVAFRQAERLFPLHLEVGANYRS